MPYRYLLNPVSKQEMFRAQSSFPLGMNRNYAG